MPRSESMRRALRGALLLAAGAAGCSSTTDEDAARRPPSWITGGVRSYGADVPTVTTVVLGSAPGESRIVTPLDGRAYAITLTGPDGGTWPDEFVFDTGMLASSLCRYAGFVRVNYETKPLPGDQGISFKARCESVATGRSDFEGVADDDSVEGTIARTFFDDRSPYTMQFTGRRVR